MTTLDPNPAIVRALSHLMKVREVATADPLFAKQSMTVYVRTLNFHEPLEARVKVRNKELEPAHDRICTLAAELGFETEFRPDPVDELESLTITYRK